MTNQQRQPAGSPKGGQFAATGRAESKVNLEGSIPIPGTNGEAKGWYSGTDLHNEDGPAVVWNDGSVEYLQNGWLHRTDGPARQMVGEDPQWWYGPGSMIPDGVKVEHHTTYVPGRSWDDPDVEVEALTFTYPDGTIETQLGDDGVVRKRTNPATGEKGFYDPCGGEQVDEDTALDYLRPEGY